MFMPLFAADYPANAEFFCQILLEVASFDAIPADEINSEVWSDSLEPSDPAAENDIGKLENLGYDSPNVLLNLTSPLIMLILSMVTFLALLLLSFIYCCCNWCERQRGWFQGALLWNVPIAFLIESYSVIAICCMLNMM